MHHASLMSPFPKDVDCKWLLLQEIGDFFSPDILIKHFVSPIIKFWGILGTKSYFNKKTELFAALSLSPNHLGKKQKVHYSAIKKRHLLA